MDQESKPWSYDLGRVAFGFRFPLVKLGGGQRKGSHSVIFEVSVDLFCDGTFRCSLTKAQGSSSPREVSS